MRRTFFFIFENGVDQVANGVAASAAHIPAPTAASPTCHRPAADPVPVRRFDTRCVPHRKRMREDPAPPQAKILGSNNRRPC